MSLDQLNNVRVISCNNCNWKYNEGETLSCVCEDEEIFNSDTQFTDHCIGYLEENFETKTKNLHDECVELLSRKQYKELLIIKEYLMNHDENMKNRIIDKYFRYGNLLCHVESDLIIGGQYYVNKKLIDTQERKYYINDKPVSENEFFKDIESERYYFENHTYMSSGHTIYKKHYRNTLSLHECVEEYKNTLDDIDIFILGDVSDEMFCFRNYEGDSIIPTMEWKMGVN